MFIFEVWVTVTLVYHINKLFLPLCYKTPIAAKVLKKQKLTLFIFIVKQIHFFTIL